MFEKLLSLLLHAKGGAVATVFVLGTTGALVTATVDNGLTTITITEPSATTTGSQTTPGSTTTNTTVTEAILALFNRTSAEEDPTSTATGKGCSDEAHARNEQMKRVNDASKDAREDVRALSKDTAKNADAKELVKDADTEIKDIRQAAVKAIHATFDCDKDDEDETSTGTSNGTTSTTTTTTTVTLNSDDAEAIADKAIEDMEKVVEDLETALEGLEDEDDSDEATTSNEKQNGKSDKAKNENKGNGKGKNK